MDVQHPTSAERYFFENNGYLTLEGFLTPEHVALLRERLERMLARRREQVAAGVAHTGMTSVNGTNTRAFYILDDDPAFLDLLDYAPLMPYVRAFLGDKAHFHASDAIWERSGGERPGWHIDGHDNGYRNLGETTPLLQLKVGYYLTDMREPGQGNLLLVPGSHRCPIAPQPEQTSGFDTFPGALQVCGPAGTAFMFHNAVWHTSGPWTKADPERVLLYYAYERPWMVGSAEHWRYPKSFYAALSPERRRFFHGFVFDPPEIRWG
jgi:ectoine hydroxylase-related dioxygenase (phytanoyl-CoA dioxygenase family)